MFFDCGTRYSGMYAALYLGGRYVGLEKPEQTGSDQYFIVRL